MLPTGLRKKIKLQASTEAPINNFTFTITVSLRYRCLSMALVNLNPSANNIKKIQHIVLFFFTFSLLTCALSDTISDFNASSSSNDVNLLSDAENLKIEISKLESLLEEYKRILHSKTVLLEENNQLIEELEYKIEDLKSALNELKASKSESFGSTMVMALEEEVQLLWAESRKNNFDYHALESKIIQDENKIDELNSEVTKMEAIVNEQWIQIRQLEQSLQMIKMMTSKVRSNTSKRKGLILLKFIRSIGHYHQPIGSGLHDSLFLGDYISKSCITKAFRQLRRTWSAIKMWHYELQDSVKWFLESNEFTAPLAHQEVVFFVASAVIVVPIMSAWALLL